MKPADVCIAVTVAVIWGLAFVTSRIALDELPPELMTMLRFVIAAVPCLFLRKPKVPWALLIAISLNLAGMVTVIGGIAVTLLSKRPQPRAKIA